MQRTLFVIPVPDDLLGIPVLGFGWVLAVWVLLSAVWIGLLVRRHGFSGETLAQLPLMLIVAAAIVWVLPILRVSEWGQMGFPIRGYGVMLVLAIVGAVGLGAHRAQRMGIHPEVIFSLAMWMILTGVLAARAFFVIQYWEKFYVPGDWRATFGEIAQVNEGGIVVYGSLIGGAAAFLAFCWYRKIPPLPLADVIAPSMLVGMFFGRLGCLLNGCCYGGLCMLPWAVTFPAGYADQHSPPYERHMENGAFYGLQLAEDEERRIVVMEVLPNSPAQSSGQVAAGDVIERINGYPIKPQTHTQTGREIPALEIARGMIRQSWDRRQDPTGSLVLTLAEKGTVRLSVAELPERSLPVHPSQLYASLNALILMLLALAYYPFRKRDGEVIALVLASYSATRFLMEMIRSDEYAIGGTGLTISQNVSLVVFGLAVALWFYVRLRGTPPVWPLRETATGRE
ncbi:MAG: prolipoprotein diacylglyceryl transferase family protein [Pirellulaceae bacterium]